MNKQGQEEIVGFAVILVIVGVILLVLIGFLISSRTDNEAVQNYEIQSFLSASLQYTSDCEDQIEFLSLQKLISACEENKDCINGVDSCKVLNETISGIMNKGWDVGEQSSIKGYIFKITVDNQETLVLNKGNITNSYKGGIQDFAKNGRGYQVYLNVYYA